jgi:DNA-binding FadR family transcriptional regulator
LEAAPVNGVSRSVIRESVKVLEQKGLVRVRQGQGTTVTAAGEGHPAAR